MANKPVLVLTPGDPDGVGPELTARLARKGHWPKNAVVIAIGSSKPFLKKGISLHSPLGKSWAGLPLLPKNHLYFIDAPVPHKGNVGGFQSGWSVERAAMLVFKGQANALVTGPISKSRLRDGGFAFSGHTALLGNLFGVRPTMMMASPNMRVALVTDHVPLSKVSRAITTKKILKTIEDTLFALKNHWRVRRPLIKVLGLNPHAGEKGTLGDEEIRVIQPAIKLAQKKWTGRATVLGPYSSDSFFSVENHASKRADAVIAMYHDQGLTPIKLLDFKRCVNISLGLPIVRTSVDHGVAFDLVGTGRADSGSLVYALELAAKFSTKKRL